MRIIVTGASGFIGTHLLELLRSSEHQVTNVDIRAPQLASPANATWRNCSILNRAALADVFHEIQPTHVIHLAAYTSIEARSLNEFSANIEGTANLLTAIKGVASVERIIVTSTQHVRIPGSGDPASDTDFIPYKYYGESKVLTERLTREAGLSCAWTIIRPTAVWGPGNLPLAEGLWWQMRRGTYFHPAHDSVVRSSGYVKNVVWQIQRLLQAPRSAIDRKVFYVADGNSRQFDWVNAVSRELVGHGVRTLPLWMIRGLALFGDGVRAVGLTFPIYGARLENLITNNSVPLAPTLQLLGEPPYSLKEGAMETAEWLKGYYQAKES